MPDHLYASSELSVSSVTHVTLAVSQAILTSAVMALAGMCE